MTIEATLTRIADALERIADTQEATSVFMAETVPPVEKPAAKPAKAEKPAKAAKPAKAEKPAKVEEPEPAAPVDLDPPADDVEVDLKMLRNAMTGMPRQDVIDALKRLGAQKLTDVDPAQYGKLYRLVTAATGGGDE